MHEPCLAVTRWGKSWGGSSQFASTRGITEQEGGKSVILISDFYIKSTSHLSV